MAGPPSPEKPFWPLPATVVISWDCRVDLANAVVGGVGEVEVAVGVEDDVEGLVELGLGGGSAVAAVAGLTGADGGADGCLQPEVSCREMGSRFSSKHAEFRRA